MMRFFCPGRAELAGSYTGQQKGRAMAAAVDWGVTAEAEPNGTGVIRVFSRLHPPFQVELDRLWPDEKEAGTFAALTRGMASVLSEKLPSLRGFDAYVASDLPPGGGLASSAAFSVLMGYIIAAFGEGGPLPPEELAHAAQKAENRWFGKPCGLLAPMACALGGGLYMDVLDNKILPIPCDFDALGLAFCLTGTGGRERASAAYAEISADMGAVAGALGEDFLAQVRPADFESQWPEHCQDRQWMRARHFFDETGRVAFMADALGLQDGGRYMDLMNQSGRSTAQLLGGVQAQDPALARCLAASAQLLEGRGAWRVPGGAGCVQALMPQEEFTRYQTAMEMLFGPGSCRRIHISAQGVRRLEEPGNAE